MHVELERTKWFLKTTNAKQEEDNKVRNWTVEIREVVYDVKGYILQVEFTSKSKVIQS